MIRPGEYLPPLPQAVGMTSGLVEENEEHQASPELPPFEPLVLWIHEEDPSKKVEVIPHLACRLRPHQREGVQFLFECVMGLRGFEGQGCILADDMGLGKTLMSITLIWTVLNQGMEGPTGPSAVQKVIVVCPTSLVGNWENELKKWVGDHCPTFAVHSDPKKRLRQFIQHRGKGILIVSYETQRRYSEMFLPGKGTAMLPNNGSPCDLLVCDEAHKLKNAESGLAKSLTALPARKRILLSGTPMQNELSEFFNMVDFCNPGVLGTPAQFRRNYERPILQSREPDASDSQIANAARLQKELSTIVNEFILKRGNILNAQHLPPKLVQYVCCKLTPMQTALYDIVLRSKQARHVRDGKQINTLNSLRYLMLICSHPELLVAAHRQRLAESKGSGDVDEELQELVNFIQEQSNQYSSKPRDAFATARTGSASRADRAVIRTAVRGAGKAGVRSGFDPELSGKFLVLYRLMCTLRVLPSKERIVIVSNSTQTLDLIEAMCRDNNWPNLRLDGSTNANKRTKLVAQFNDMHNNSFAFLLSSKAGGCGINLIGGSRLVMFDPDWNPASDKQAAARIWREGQQRRCYIYRFMSTCTVEEKIIQRQLSKEGLQNIVDDKDQVNQFSSSELKSIFRRRKDLTCSDTHDTLRCKRCSNVRTLDPAAMEDLQKLTPEHTSLCMDFLRNKMGPLVAELTTSCLAINPESEPFSREIERVLQDLECGKFATLPQFSKRLRDSMKRIDNEIKELLGQSSLFTDFIEAWSQIVPELTAVTSKVRLPTKKAETCASGGKENVPNGASEGIGDGDEEEEYVEQEGCPDEEDFNRWSHHTSVNTCDDEALQRAMGDDNTVSFVFGLEVNWSLLQAKVALEADAEERRKEQLRLDLLSLNAERRRAKRRSLGVASDSEEEERGRCDDEDGEEDSQSDDGHVPTETLGKDVVVLGREKYSSVKKLIANRRQKPTVSAMSENGHSDSDDSKGSLDDFIVQKKPRRNVTVSSPSSDFASPGSTPSRQSKKRDVGSVLPIGSDYDEHVQSSVKRGRCTAVTKESSKPPKRSLTEPRSHIPTRPSRAASKSTLQQVICEDIICSETESELAAGSDCDEEGSLSSGSSSQESDAAQDDSSSEVPVAGDNSESEEEPELGHYEEEKAQPPSVSLKKSGVRFNSESLVLPLCENEEMFSLSPEREKSVACPKCTYFNPVDSRKCKMCLTSLMRGDRTNGASRKGSMSNSASRKRLALPVRRK